MNRASLYGGIAIMIINGFFSTSAAGDTNTFNAPSVGNQVEAVLNGNLADIVKGVVTAAGKGDGKTIAGLVSQEYRETLEDFSQNAEPHVSVDKAILANFDYYTILAIDKVIVDKDVAFVQAKIVYRPDKLRDIIEEEKDNKDTEDNGSGNWTNFGGTACSSKWEEAGFGLATYYLVMQNGAWRLHFTYFSLKPIPPEQLEVLTTRMRTLVHK